MPELSPEENAALRRACSAIRDGADVPDHFKDFLKELGVTSFPKPSSTVGSAAARRIPSPLRWTTTATSRTIPIRRL